MNDQPTLAFDIPEAVERYVTIPVKAHRRRVSGESPIPRHRVKDPDTSKQAARPSRARVEARILVAFTQHAGLTDDELADLLPDVHPPTCKSARSRLSGAGLLSDTGERRPSKLGCAMAVWRIA